MAAWKETCVVPMIGQLDATLIIITTTIIIIIIIIIIICDIDLPTDRVIDDRTETTIIIRPIVVIINTSNFV